MLSFIKRYAGFFLLSLGIVGLVVVNLTAVSAEEGATTAATPSTTPTASDGYLFVDVKGAVWNPDVYRLPTGSRIIDAIGKAGGLRPEADVSLVNCSATLADEQVIIVPEKTETTGTEAGLVCVDLKGEVGVPGVYCLPAGSMVADAIERAGGLSDAANDMTVNLAAKIQDEQVILIPAKTAGTEEPVVGYAYVTLKGLIIKPGLYYVKNTSTLGEVVFLAGGPSIGGSTANLDLSAVVKTGMVVTVLSRADAEALVIPSEEEETGDTPAGSLININTASKTELVSLYGIGEVLAQAIIDYRSENGDFESIEDIMLVSGIKESVYEAIKDDIGV